MFEALLEALLEAFLDVLFEALLDTALAELGVFEGLTGLVLELVEPAGLVVLGCLDALDEFEVLVELAGLAWLAEFEFLVTPA